MKVFYYSGATLPSEAAKSVHVMKMCQALGQAGHDVTLFGKRGGQERDENVFQFYGTNAVFGLSRAPNVKIPFISGVVRLLHARKQTQALGKPDLMYGRDPVALTLFCPPDVSVAYELHQMPYVAGHKWAVPRLMRHPGFRGFVVISQNLKDDLLAAYPDLKEKQVLVAHDGADLPEKSVNPVTLQGRADAIKIGYTGSLHPGKGADHLIAVAAALPEYDVHIVGGTPAQIEAMKTAGVPDNVYFYGHIPHAGLPGYLAAFDILAAPYQEKATIGTGRDIARWISPMKLFEYMAARKPVICSDLPVIREILEHGRNAVLVPPADVEGWARGIRDIKNHPALAKQGFSDLQNHYTWARRAESVINFCAQKL